MLIKLIKIHLFIDYQINKNPSIYRLYNYIFRISIDENNRNYIILEPIEEIFYL